MAKFQIDLLDVGAIEYGDSILIQAGGLTALVDGGKRASCEATSSQVLGEPVTHIPLDAQIRELLGGTELDLLVITHCHADHIGCLPRLFSEGRLSCKFALVADAQLGYGITAHSDLLPDFAAMKPQDKLRLSLREEPVTSADRAEITAFVEDSAREYSDYLSLLKRLKQAIGEKCVEYRGPDEAESPGLAALLEAMAAMHLKIYGPTLTQLIRCAAFLEERSEDDVEPVAEALRVSHGDLATAYRALQPIPSDGDIAGDSVGENGNAVNNQSLVFSVGDGTRRVLLTGDMQFVRPQLADGELKAEMKQLVGRVTADAPFAFVKVAHHGASNGQNLEFLRKLGAVLFGISTGSRSNKHPTDQTLQALKALSAENPIQWARVDMNGGCRFAVVDEKNLLSVSRNGVNDATPAALRSGDSIEAAAPAVPAPSAFTVSKSATSEPSSPGADGVEVVIRIPRGVPKVSVTIEVAGAPLE